MGEEGLQERAYLESKGRGEKEAGKKAGIVRGQPYQEGCSPGADRVGHTR